MAVATSQTDLLRADPAVVRQWARINGYQVGERGRLPGDVVDAYNATLIR
jgi:hypothetical protein